MSKNEELLDERDQSTLDEKKTKGNNGSTKDIENPTSHLDHQSNLPLDEEGRQYKLHERQDTDDFRDNPNQVHFDGEGDSFYDSLRERAVWLVGLLIFQSLAGFILRSNEELLRNHVGLVNYLTMLVGAGGNAGNQACVRVIRYLSVGTLDNNATLKRYFIAEFKMALCLSGILAFVGFFRTALFRVYLAETIVITLSLFTIVIVAVMLGAFLPICMSYVGIDPVHSATTIQVLMDILGVTITCFVGWVILEAVGWHQ
mmetsp:Transcript_40748/g.49610  ORF Transcript_40748/g.49610 Transcript_40748/m.49610 type:complete len:258 (-) Transcript_40748:478-1251(-)|eukprot:CAMPEP_0172510356 /NCGR_PEP_ID=MMETSP1066-20121228/227792_1 /TAXON_ID=671091 /ORGANISM="Coscinodiscus wailesii, Strain CCMP2513" /LENGTH=257 /DNA_ID=CAMNT_0013289269 /DNA_START=183 /DNA_END=956 /DNA_ORIENTATION=-